MDGTAGGTTTATARVDRRLALRLGALLGGASLLPLLDPGVVGRVTAAWPGTAGTAPWLVPSSALLFHLWAPLVTAAATVMLLAPGLLLALALDAGSTAAAWLLRGGALSLVAVSVLAAAAQAIAGVPPTGRAFGVLVVLAGTGCFALLWARIGRRGAPASPLARPRDRTVLAASATLVMVLLVALGPKIYWEDFNGDGAHAFEATRLLLQRPLPFWDPGAGDVAGFPGFTSMLFAYPASWFLRLFGPAEAAVRLPLLIALVMLQAGIVAVADLGEGAGRRRPPARADHRVAGPPEGRPAPSREHTAPRGLLWWISLALVVYTVSLGFSATYNPYFADLALPAPQDTLFVAVFLGFVLAFVEGSAGWMALFGALTYTSLPSGTLLMAMWLGTVVVLWRPWPRRRLLTAAGVLAGCVLVAATASALLGAWGLAAGGEYGLAALARRFAVIQVWDVGRLRFLALPVGILPALALLDVGAQDRLARTLTLVTVAYFLFFYVPARAALHHFVPAMLLPLVVLARSRRWQEPRWSRALLPAATVGGLAALFLSWPVHAGPHRAGRQVGAHLEDRLGGYTEMAPAAFRRSELLSHLFPYVWDPRVPGEAYGGSPLVWFHYAQRVRDTDDATHYVLQSPGDPAPPRGRRVAGSADADLWVVDPAGWERDLARRPPAPPGAPVYVIQRGLLFGGLPLEPGTRVIDLVEVAEAWGIDVEALAERLGARRP